MSKAKQPPKAQPPSDGGLAFFAYLELHKITYQQAGDALGVSDVTVLDWCRARKRPVGAHPEAIEIYTGGVVHRDLWLPAEEREKARATRERLLAARAA